MQIIEDVIRNYQQVSNNYFKSDYVKQQIKGTIEKIKNTRNLFFIGNGGSNAICSHMAEDFFKMANIPSMCFSDSSLITCLSNDYYYENAVTVWLDMYYKQKSHKDGDSLLIAISSSGNSQNIINAANYVGSHNTITLTGFNQDNSLKKLGNVNFWIDSQSYGIVECYHQVILHIVLDVILRKG